MQQAIGRVSSNLLPPNTGMHTNERYHIDDGRQPYFLDFFDFFLLFFVGFFLLKFSFAGAAFFVAELESINLAGFIDLRRLFLVGFDGDDVSSPTSSKSRNISAHERERASEEWNSDVSLTISTSTSEK